MAFTCDQDGCNVGISHTMAYCCEADGCGGHFCYAHLFIEPGPHRWVCGFHHAEATRHLASTERTS